MANTKDRVISDLQIFVDGVPLPIESSTARIVGLLGVEREPITVNAGNDGYSEARVTTTINANITFKESVNEDDLNFCGVQVSCRQGEAKWLFHNCTTKSLGEVGDKSAQLEIMCLGRKQRL